MDSSIPQKLDECSPSSTTIKFDHPIPLLRGPVPASSSDDPSSRPYVLAAASKIFEFKIIEQCDGGARIGCAIAASNKCNPPWWHNFIGGKYPDLKEREMCEEREMEGCLGAAKEKFIGFAKCNCWRSFSEARIAAGEGMLSEKVVRKFVCLVSMLERSKWGWFDGI
ncbi:uncharacterized protein LOC131183033 [Hevea brasiliensis]|uniref:uncharacterized protein LOC131183033 n=1 Tax=Hevea brasiliensis TaxID=3981 RepID=UPI0025DC23FD|nr:uncharacterized protein LOC131183033 [Hevea brasiliensis]